MRLDFLKVLFDWQVIVVIAVVLVLLPLVFFIASLDKSPTRIARVKVAKKVRAAKSAPKDKAPKPEIDEDEIPAASGKKGRGTEPEAEKSSPGKK